MRVSSREKEIKERGIEKAGKGECIIGVIQRTTVATAMVVVVVVVVVVAFPRQWKKRAALRHD